MQNKTLVLLKFFCVVFLPLLSGCYSFSYQPSQITFASDEETVPLTVNDDRFVAEIMVNGTGPHRFLVDTGNSGVEIFDTLADKLKLQTSPWQTTQMTPFGTFTAVTVQLSRAESIQWGSTVFRGTGALVRSRMSSQEKDVEGIIGFGLLENVVWTFDGPGKRVILRRPAKVLSTAGFGNELPMRLFAGLPVIRASIADESTSQTWPVELIVDTGNSSGIPNFLLPVALQDKIPHLPISIDGEAATAKGAVDVRSTMLTATLTIGNEQFSRPTVAYVQVPLGGVGASVLKHYVITFDAARSRMWMRRQSPVVMQ